MLKELIEKLDKKLKKMADEKAKKPCACGDKKCKNKK
jgi:hypothetical protein